ncbi:hypothetical protein X975_18555, partial [Stegodyphus mimosarum]
MNIREFILVFTAICMCLVTAEYRKLIPVCEFNSCENPAGFRTSYCFCDSKCSLIYNDCCLDAPYRTFRVAIKRRFNNHCIFVHGENKHFWLVDTCKKSWVGHEHIKEKCMEQQYISGESSDIIGALPVTNPKEGVTYKNYYCGLCNDENVEELVEWQVKTVCPNKCILPQDVLQNLTFVESERQWGVWKMDATEEWKFYECYLLFQRPEGVTNGIRQCVSGMVSSCPPSWKNMTTRRKCKSYVDPVQWSDGPVYKNIDCAVCHNKTRENFRCVYDITRESNAVLLRLAMPVDLNAMGQWF